MVDVTGVLPNALSERRESGLNRPCLLHMVILFSQVLGLELVAGLPPPPSDRVSYLQRFLGLDLLAELCAQPNMAHLTLIPRYQFLKKIHPNCTGIERRAKKIAYLSRQVFHQPLRIPGVYCISPRMRVPDIRQVRISMGTFRLY